MRPTHLTWKKVTPLALFTLALLLSLWLAPRATTGESSFPAAWNFGLRAPIDAFKGQIIANRADLAIFQFFFDPLSDVIDAGLRSAEAVLLAIPWPVFILGWMLLGYWLSGPALALLCGFALVVMGLFGLWEPSLQTLALMLVSVFLSVLIGVPLGIATAFNDRFDKILRPILDAMQTMPTFVYLIPVVLFFGIARVPAVIATLIYAIPPMIRLTNLGLREVSPPAIEAARSFGSTARQMLFKVQLPLALPAILAGVNQTIMMALGMVVIAALIGAGGLGSAVLVSLQRLQVGRALEAGIAIVLLAIMLDRLSEALAQFDFPMRQSRPLFFAAWLPARARRHADLIAGLAGLGVLLLVDLFVHFGEFPTTWRFYLREPTDALVTWMRNNLFEIPLGALAVGTGPISDFIIIYLLNPLRALFAVLVPWPTLVVAIAALGYWAGGWRLALFSGAGFFAVGWLGMWAHGMETLSQILVIMLFTVLIAIPLGIWSSQNDRLRDVLRPTLDFLQTIPSFVFLVPVIMLFNIGRVPGVIAAVIYAIAPGVRLTDLGIRRVPVEAVEAAQVFGSTQAQTLAKVQVPMALPAILLGVNQMIMMALAMVIISGMVGGAGLGLEAVNGLARNETGRGLEAGIAIVLIAVIMDRITQAFAARQ